MQAKMKVMPSIELGVEIKPLNQMIQLITTSTMSWFMQR
jgi:hypothetical protein